LSLKKILVIVISNSQSIGLDIRGNNNSVSGGQVNGIIQITGNNNIIYKSGTAKVKIVSGSGNRLIGFDDKDVTDGGVGTIIK
jgi:hypothetical protein